MGGCGTAACAAQGPSRDACWEPRFPGFQAVAGKAHGAAPPASSVHCPIQLCPSKLVAPFPLAPTSGALQAGSAAPQADEGSAGQHGRPFDRPSIPKPVLG